MLSNQWQEWELQLLDQALVARTEALAEVARKLAPSLKRSYSGVYQKLYSLLLENPGKYEAARLSELESQVTQMSRELKALKSRIQRLKLKVAPE